MKRNLFAVALMAISIGLAVTSCSSMLNSLSASINEMNQKLENLEIAPVPTEEGKEKAAALAASNKAENKAKNDSKVAAKDQKTAGKSVVSQSVMPKGNSKFVGTPYTVLPAGTGGTLGTKGTYVLFGDWPQTIKADNVRIDESQIAVVGAHVYYKGSDGAWYIKIMENKGGGFNGNQGNRYSDGTKVQTSYRKSYRYFKVEPIKWRILTKDYKGTKKKLLLAESVLTTECFCETFGDDAKFYEIDNGTYEFNLDVTLRKLKDGTLIQHNNYEHSRIRAFLNGLTYVQGNEDIYLKGIDIPMVDNDEFQDKGFLQTAFTPELQKKIAVTTVENNSLKNSGVEIMQEYTDRDRKIYNGQLSFEKGRDHKKITLPRFTSNNTQDKVFLLCPAEVTNKNYGFVAIPPKIKEEDLMKNFWAGKTWTQADISTTYTGLARPMTDFTRARGATQFSDEVVTCWWLRSAILPPYFHRLTQHREIQHAASVCDLPYPGEEEVRGKGVGVVPAICVY